MKCVRTGAVEWCLEQLICRRYCADKKPGPSSIYRLMGARGGLGEPRPLADNPDCDGMALDAEGNLWISGFSSGELRHLRPDGSEVGRLTLPVKACSNVCFGGADMRDLCVTGVDPACAQALAEGRALETP